MEKYFYGKKVSEYGVKNNRVDYRCLSSIFDGVLCNNISNMELTLVSECKDYNYIDKDGNYTDDCTKSKRQEPIDVFQYIIVSDNAFDILNDANEIVYYNEELDVYVWGITHFGTSWDYVLTEIEIDW